MGRGSKKKNGRDVAASGQVAFAVVATEVFGRFDDNARLLVSDLVRAHCQDASQVLRRRLELGSHRRWWSLLLEFRGSPSKFAPRVCSSNFGAPRGRPATSAGRGAGADAAGRGVLGAAGGGRAVGRGAGARTARGRPRDPRRRGLGIPPAAFFFSLFDSSFGSSTDHCGLCSVGELLGSETLTSQESLPTLSGLISHTLSRRTTI